MLVILNLQEIYSEKKRRKLKTSCHSPKKYFTNKNIFNYIIKVLSL